MFSEIQSYQLCDGVKDSVGSKFVNEHSIPYEINLEDPIQSSNQAKSVNQSSDCRILLNVIHVESMKSQMKGKQE